MNEVKLNEMKLKHTIFLLYGKCRAGICRFAVSSFMSLITFLYLSAGMCQSAVFRLNLAEALALGTVFAVLPVLFFERKQARLGRREMGICAGSTLLFIVLNACLLPPVLYDDYADLALSGEAAAMVFGGFCCMLECKGRERAVLALLCLLLKAAAAALLLVGMLELCKNAFSLLLLSLPPAWNGILNFLFIFMMGWQVFLGLLPDREKQMPDMTSLEKFLSYLVLPVYGVLLFILYANVLKILSEGILPVAEVHWYVSLALLGYVIFYLCLQKKNKHKLIQGFLHWGGVLFIPLLFLQFVCIWTRYEAYGLTWRLVLSLLCLACGIYTLVLGYLQALPRRLFLVLAAGSIIFSLTPLNIIDLASMEQQARIMQLLQKSNMYVQGEIVSANPRIKDAEEIKSAYDYLMADGSARHFAFVRQLQDSSVMSSEMKKVWTRQTKLKYITYLERESRILSVAGYREEAVIQSTKIKQGKVMLETPDGKIWTYDIQYAIDVLREKYPEMKSQKVQQEDLVIDLPDGNRFYIKTICLNLPDENERQETAKLENGNLEGVFLWK